MITLRIADINDAGLIADISRETFYDTFAIHNSEKDMEKFLADQFSRELLMEQVGAAGDVGKGFVDGDLFHQGCQVVQAIHHQA